MIIIKNTNIKLFFEKLIQSNKKPAFEFNKEQLLSLLNYLDASDAFLTIEESEVIENKSIAICEILINETICSTESIIPTVLYVYFKTENHDKNAIRQKFGQSVGDIFEGLLKIPNLNSEKIVSQSENFIKLLLTITGDVRAILIRLAEEIYKLRNIDTVSETEQYQIAIQSSGLFAPLAHRLGLYKLKTEMEESSMKYTNKEMYKFIANKLKETKKNRDDYTQNFILPIKEKLDNAGFKVEVKGRPKSIFSIWNKMKKQNVPFEEVYDLFAIRVIIDTPIEREKEDCWRVYSLITESYKTNPKRLRDWISSPKSSGYESLHTTVLGAENKWVEVQIRTERMDNIAEKGLAAHWKYKGNENTENQDWMKKLREAIENPIPIEHQNDDKIKAALYSNEIFVFTPEGDLKQIKLGYTVLDFAFILHSKIGETCTGATIDGKIKPISYQIKNGETVKILTSKTQKPNNEWLKIAKSSKVLSKIKKSLLSYEYKDSENGKEIIKQKLNQLKVEFSDINIAKLKDYFKVQNSIQLYHDFGSGKLDVLKIKKAFEKPELENKPEIKEISAEILKLKLPAKDDYLLIDNNLTTFDYQLAKCCNPIPGDEIFGFVTVSKGTKIHKQNCPNSVDLIKRYSYRVVSAKWNVNNPDAAFMATIIISGKDQMGMTSLISTIITEDFKLKIKAITLNTRQNELFDGYVVVFVNNRKQLISLIERLKKIKDINVVKEKF